jgi:hypothetical protein
MTVSSDGLVKNAREGARASKEGKAAFESVEDTERGESGAIVMMRGLKQVRGVVGRTLPGAGHLGTKA